MKRTPPTQESLRFPQPQEKHAIGTSNTISTRSSVTNLVERRRQANGSVRAKLVTDVCARASHLTDVISRRTK